MEALTSVYVDITETVTKAVWYLSSC